MLGLGNIWIRYEGFDQIDPATAPFECSTIFFSKLFVINMPCHHNINVSWFTDDFGHFKNQNNHEFDWRKTFGNKCQRGGYFLTDAANDFIYQ